MPKTTMFYCQQGYPYSPQSSLQKAVQFALQPLDGVLLTDAAVLRNYLEKKLSEMNQKHPRCAPLAVRSHRYDQNNRMKLTIYNPKAPDNMVLSFTLIPVTGMLAQVGGTDQPPAQPLPVTDGQVAILVRKEVANV